jgi:hypothetical protein
MEKRKVIMTGKDGGQEQLRIGNCNLKSQKINGKERPEGLNTIRVTGKQTDWK